MNKQLTTKPYQLDVSDEITGTQPVEEELCVALSVATAQTRRTINSALIPLELDVRHYGVMSVLIENGALSQQKIGKLLYIDRATMVGVVDRLEARGAVERLKNPEDRRSYSLTITPLGEELFRAVDEQMEIAKREAWEGLSESEYEQLHVLLLKLIRR